MTIRCENCGTENELTSSYCQSCGNTLMAKGKQASPAKTEDHKTYQDPHQQPIQHPPPQQYSVQTPQYPTMQPVSTPGYSSIPVPYPEYRSYRYWLLLSIITFGIANIIYQYKISEDLTHLEHHTKHNYTEWAPYHTRVNVGEMLIFLIIFAPIFYYKKYNTLHQHLKVAHNEHRNLPLSGQEAVIFGILGFFFGIITLGLGFIVFFFVSLHFESKWQNALNQHIINHGVPVAPRSY